MATESNTWALYACITTNQPNAISNPNYNPGPNPTTKQHPTKYIIFYYYITKSTL